MEIDEFMAFIAPRPKEERWHLINGVAVRGARPTLAHQRVEMNLCDELNRALAARPRGVSAYPRIAVRVPGVMDFQPQPDVVVARAPATNDLFAEDFCLIGEIVSSSNTRYEIELKLRRYREATGNLYVLLIEPREFRVEIHARSREWRTAVLTRSDDRIELPELGLNCTVGDLYRGTSLAQQQG